MIQWIAYPSFISPATVDEIQELVKSISHDLVHNTESVETLKYNTALFSSRIRYFNPDIALAYSITILSEKIMNPKKQVLLGSFIQNMDSCNIQFSVKISKVFRGMFLMDNMSLDICQLNYKILLGFLKVDECFASMFLMSNLYKLANDKDPDHHIMLLKGIPEFGVIKENIPIILNTLQALNQKNMTIICIELYLRLWKIEPRTYSFLFKILSENTKGLEWEQHITKANTIKEICEHKLV